jgi:putative methanogenesis marker domain 9
MLKIGYLEMDSPLVVIFPNNGSGEMRDFNGSAGLILVGSFNLDQVSLSEVKKAIEVVNADSPMGFSMTGSSRKNLTEAAELAAGGGYLLDIECTGGSHLDEVADQVRVAKISGATVSVNFRPEALGDERTVARKLKEAGADLIHLDLTRTGKRSGKVIKRFSDSGGPKIMARYDVADFDDAELLLSMGADLIALNGKTDPEFASWLSEALKTLEDLIGWYNAPKHICSGGDLRGLAFCCPPVKNCPIMGALHKLNITPRDFAETKMELARGTPLEHGDGTCFGSLVWCCKITKPCFMRDAVLDRIGLSPRDYMKLKKKLAEDILKS